MAEMRIAFFDPVIEDIFQCCFIFGTDIDGTEGLELVTKKAIEDSEKDKILSRKINFVIGCMGVAALTLTAVQTFKKMKI